MLVRVYGRSDCGICNRAKEKMDRLGVEYEARDVDRCMTWHEGWRTDGSVDLMVHAQMALENDHLPLPIIQIDNQFYTYSGAMKELKKRGRKLPVRRAIPMSVQEPALQATA
jgi:hypothetical protein